jgi:hypothetical protein
MYIYYCEFLWKDKFKLTSQLEASWIYNYAFKLKYVRKQVEKFEDKKIDFPIMKCKVTSILMGWFYVQLSLLYLYSLRVRLCLGVRL